MTWRKQSIGYWGNPKTVAACAAAGPMAGILGCVLLDLNTEFDRDGALSERESSPAYLAYRLSAIQPTTTEEVARLLEVLIEVDFVRREGDAALRITGWTREEWGVRSTGTKSGLAERECDHCGNAFQPSRSTHRFCTTSCRQASSRNAPRDGDASGDACATQERRSSDATTRDRPDQIDRPEERERPEGSASHASRPLPELVDALAARSGGAPPDGVVGVLVGLGIATKNGEATDRTRDLARTFTRGGGGRDDLLLLWKHCQKRGRSNPHGMLVTLIGRESSWRPAVTSEREGAA